MKGKTTAAGMGGPYRTVWDKLQELGVTIQTANIELQTRKEGRIHAIYRCPSENVEAVREVLVQAYGDLKYVSLEAMQEQGSKSE
jgi:hypothetical protein